MNYTHKNLAEGRWRKMSLAEQMGNIGSEIERTISWEKKGNKEYSMNAFYRALELIDLTISDKRWSGPKTKELTRLRESVCDLFAGNNIYNTSYEYLQKYFYQFALMAKMKS